MVNVVGYIGTETRYGFNAFRTFFNDQIAGVGRRFNPFLGFDGLLSGGNTESLITIVDL